MSEGPRDADGLAVTALYTAAVWQQAGVPGAELVTPPDAKHVRRVVDGALGAARLLMRRWPVLGRSLRHRHAMIDALVRAHVAAAAGSQVQVLELASGLSPRGVGLGASLGVPYTEVDRPGVVAAKREQLQATPEGRHALGRAGWTLRGGDLLEALAPDGEGLVGFLAEPDAAVIVVAEGLLVYWDVPTRRRLFAAVASLLAPRGGAFVADLVPGAEEPEPGWLGRALGRALSKATEGHGFETAKVTRADIRADLRAAGFAQVDDFHPGRSPPGTDLDVPAARAQSVVWSAHV